jgi:hypothetical protein
VSRRSPRFCLHGCSASGQTNKAPIPACICQSFCDLYINLLSSLFRVVVDVFGSLVVEGPKKSFVGKVLLIVCTVVVEALSEIWEWLPLSCRTSRGEHRWHPPGVHYGDPRAPTTYVGDVDGSSPGRHCLRSRSANHLYWRR